MLTRRLRHALLSPVAIAQHCTESGAPATNDRCRFECWGPLAASFVTFCARRRHASSAAGQLVAIIVATADVDLLFAIAEFLLERHSQQTEIKTFGSAGFWTTTQASGRSHSRSVSSPSGSPAVKNSHSAPIVGYVERIAAPEMLMHFVPRPASNSGQNVLIDDLLALFCDALEMSPLPANAQYLTTHSPKHSVARCSSNATTSSRLTSSLPARNTIQPSLQRPASRRERASRAPASATNG
jgi:hypothetical protein